MRYPLQKNFSILGSIYLAKIEMTKLILALLLCSFVTLISCSDDDNNVTPNNPPSGEVFLATVAKDSVGVTSGGSEKSSTVASATLNFTDRDSARISFYYTESNNISSVPLIIYFLGGQSDTILYQLDNLVISTSEQFVNITVPSPRVDAFFKYKISTNSTPGFSYFKFRDLNIYKK